MIMIDDSWLDSPITIKEAENIRFSDIVRLPPGATVVGNPSYWNTPILENDRQWDLFKSKIGDNQLWEWSTKGFAAVVSPMKGLAIVRDGKVLETFITGM